MKTSKVIFYTNLIINVFLIKHNLFTISLNNPDEDDYDDNDAEYSQRQQEDDWEQAANDLLSGGDYQETYDYDDEY
jgi:hypothetical protein